MENGENTNKMKPYSLGGIANRAIRILINGVAYDLLAREV